MHAGVIGDKAMAGPGWGSEERSYTVGDRVLLHTKSGHAGLHNGSVGTVVGVRSDGLRVAFEDGDEVLLGTHFVQGRRGDGNPNLSHAWARTIDGAQGGTWEAVHLLGTSSLDALLGYTGQSRGKAPTHTWNTRPLVVAEVGGMAADDRSPAEVVLAGLSREPVTTFAAIDDPWVLDARLSAERAEHLGVLATAPPDRRRTLDDARTAAYRAASAHISATNNLQRAQSRLGSFGPLAGLRRTSRSERAFAEDWASRAQEELDRASDHRRAAERSVAALEEGERDRLWFGVKQAWRVERVKAIDAELDRHWATATLGAVRQDDPLAFGIDRLRGSRATWAKDLAALEVGLPADRTHAVRRVERDLVDAEHGLRQARFAATEKRRDLAVASQRHWGRRDKQAVTQRQRAVDRADDAVSAAVAAERHARRRLEVEQAAQQERARAIEAVAPRRVELIQALTELDAALDDTRAARVVAMAAEVTPPAHLAAVLVEPPADSAGRRAWCGLVYGVESYRDRHPEALGYEGGGGVMAAIGPRPAARWLPDAEWDRLADRLADASAIVGVASQLGNLFPGSELGGPSAWMEGVEDARATLDAVRSSTSCPPDLVPDRGLSRDHGMELGW